MTTTNNRIIKYDGYNNEYIGIYTYNGNKYMVFAPWDVKNKGIPTVLSIVIDNDSTITTNIEVGAWSYSSNAIAVLSSDMIASAAYIGRICRFTVIPN